MSDSTTEVRVLHVDDDTSFGELVAKNLEAEADRITVQTVGSSDAGLEVIDQQDIDCVVSDYAMPDANGIEFLETVRESYPDLPFILLTGRGSESVASDAISAGVTDYFEKRASTDQYTVLANRITNAVDSYRSQQLLDERERSLRQYKRMVNSMQEAACIYDADGQFVVVNEYLAAWYDKSPSELVGQSSNLIPKIRNDNGEDVYQALLAGEKQEVTGEVEGSFPGHGEAVLQYTLSPLRGNEQTDRVVGVARDITEKKRAKQELARQNERLEEFTSVLSHDLRNPLEVATGWLDAFLEEYDGENEAYLQEVENAHTRIETLVEQMLTLTRSGDPVLQPNPISVGTLVEESWATVPTAEATVEITADCRIRADRSRLKRLVENLLRNAVEHGGEDVTITVGRIDGGFYIADDGEGIDPDNRETIFETGYSTGDDGTGFGLTIVSRIAEAHGWECSVTESDAGGARFEITGVEFVDD